MKPTEELIQSDRLWDSIILQTDYGYFGDIPPVSITCYSDGELIFEVKKGNSIMPIEKTVCDFEHSLSKKSLSKLDDLINEISRIECLEGMQIIDGPSFDCYIHLSNGTMTGFHYVSMILSEKFAELEATLRQLLREEFFLKKHKKDFGF